MRAAWLTAGALVTVFALVLSTALIWQGIGRARTPEEVSERSIPFTRDRLAVRADKGQVNVVVIRGKAGELLLQRTLSWSRDRPTVSEDWDAGTGTLRLEAVCPGYDQPDGPLCQADYLLLVPSETSVEAGTTGGDLAVSDVFGDVRLTSVSGNILARDITGDVWARSGSGDVFTEELGGDAADVEVGSGNVHVTFVSPPTSVRAVVRTTGDVTVILPPHAYDLTTEAANATIDVDKDPASPRKVTAKAPGGSVTVCC
ncbi:hypothetical protein [Nonomuraea sp. NPDC002799]